MIFARSVLPDAANFRQTGEFWGQSATEILAKFAVAILRKSANFAPENGEFGEFWQNLGESGDFWQISRSQPKILFSQVTPANWIQVAETILVQFFVKFSLTKSKILTHL